MTVLGQLGFIALGLHGSWGWGGSVLPRSTEVPIALGSVSTVALCFTEDTISLRSGVAVATGPRSLAGSGSPARSESAYDCRLDRLTGPSAASPERSRRGPAARLLPPQIVCINSRHNLTRAVRRPPPCSVARRGRSAVLLMRPRSIARLDRFGECPEFQPSTPG